MEATMTRTYAATARKEGRWWFVDVPELDTAGQARSACEAEAVAREVIGLVLDVDPATVNVTVTIEVPETVKATWQEARARETVAREQETIAASLARKAVRELRTQGFTLKDAGAALGLSPQRIHQLAA